MKKLYGSASEALEGLLFDGMFIAAGALVCVVCRKIYWPQ